VIRDHFITMFLFSLLVAAFFATLNHRDRKGFARSMAKTLAWMIPGSLLFAYLMLWTSA